MAIKFLQETIVFGNKLFFKLIIELTFSRLRTIFFAYFRFRTNFLDFFNVIDNIIFSILCFRRGKQRIVKYLNSLFKILKS